MKNSIKLASAILATGLLITPISVLVNQYDNVAKAEYNHIQKKKAIFIVRKIKK